MFTAVGVSTMLALCCVPGKPSSPCFADSTPGLVAAPPAQTGAHLLRYITGAMMVHG